MAGVGLGRGIQIRTLVSTTKFACCLRIGLCLSVRLTCAINTLFTDMVRSDWKEFEAGNFHVAHSGSPGVDGMG